MELKPDERLNQARNNFYSFCKLMNPRFFRDDLPYQMELCNMLQDLFYKNIINLVTGEIYTKMIVDLPPGKSCNLILKLFSQWCMGVNNDSRIINVQPDQLLADQVANQIWSSMQEKNADHRLTIFKDIFPEVSINYGSGPAGPWGICGNSFNYIATRYGASLSGLGCTVGIIEAPPEDEKQNGYIQSWYYEVFLSRIYDNGIQIIATHDWTKNSLISRMINEDEWLCFTVNPDDYSWDWSP